VTDTPEVLLSGGARRSPDGSLFSVLVGLAPEAGITAMATSLPGFASRYVTLELVQG